MRARRRVMGLVDVTLFTVSAILVVDQLTASASIGTGTLGWWVLAIVFFFIPYALITAELATTYPEQGGIYVWTKRAFGKRWAARNDLLVLGQRGALDALGVPAVRRALLPAVHLAAGPTGRPGSGRRC